MQTAVINIRVEPKTKSEAKKVVKDLGLSLSGAIEGFLKHLIRTKTVVFSLKEEPTEYMISALREADEDIKAGRVTSFKTWKEEKRYLDKLIVDDKKRNRS